jgi:HPr kinase/phosphorylase
MKPTRPQPRVTVEKFYRTHKLTLELEILGGHSGINRNIREGAVNRPGLALSGFYKSFAEKRVQLIGRHETAYLKQLSPQLQRQRISEFFSKGIPCVIFSRNIRPPKIFLEEAEQHKVPVFSSPMITLRLVNAATLCLESDFAPTGSEHGSMVDIQGVGVLIRGESGVGKSESVLGLIERGYSLVADDVCRWRLQEGKDLIISAPTNIRHHMEIRGLGIINVGATFGVGAIRLNKRLDLVVTLSEWNPEADMDRTGLDQIFYEILGIKIPHAIIPLRPGRDAARLIEVAALDAKLRYLGLNSAEEFNRRLIAEMSPSKT